MIADAGLRTVIDVWPSLPWHVKAKIMCMTIHGLLQEKLWTDAVEVIQVFFVVPVLAGPTFVVFMIDLVIMLGR